MATSITFPSESCRIPSASTLDLHQNEKEINATSNTPFKLVIDDQTPTQDVPLSSAATATSDNLQKLMMMKFFSATQKSNTPRQLSIIDSCMNDIISSPSAKDDKCTEKVALDSNIGNLSIDSGTSTNLRNNSDCSTASTSSSSGIDFLALACKWQSDVEIKNFRHGLSETSTNLDDIETRCIPVKQLHDSGIINPCDDDDDYDDDDYDDDNYHDNSSSKSMLGNTTKNAGSLVIRKNHDFTRKSKFPTQIQNDDEIMDLFFESLISSFNSHRCALQPSIIISDAKNPIETLNADNGDVDYRRVQTQQSIKIDSPLSLTSRPQFATSPAPSNCMSLEQWRNVAKNLCMEYYTFARKKRVVPGAPCIKMPVTGVRQNASRRHDRVSVHSKSTIIQKRCKMEIDNQPPMTKKARYEDPFIQKPDHNSMLHESMPRSLYDSPKITGSDPFISENISKIKNDKNHNVQSPPRNNKHKHSQNNAKKANTKSTATMISSNACTDTISKKLISKSNSKGGRTSSSLSTLSPTTSSSSKRRAGNHQKLFCICRKPYVPNSFMIECDNCDEWYHGSCVGLSESYGKKFDKWYCRSCQEESGLKPVLKGSSNGIKAMHGMNAGSKHQK